MYASGYYMTVSNDKTAVYDFGDGVVLSGCSPGNATNAILVKYSPSGVAQWARCLSSESGFSSFTNLAIDGTGNIYTAGFIRGTKSYSGINKISSQISAIGSSNGQNAVLCKYDSNGDLQWIRTTSEGSVSSAFSAVTVDASGNIYTAGTVNGQVKYSFGSFATVTGLYNYTNAAMVKYSSNGEAQWAKTIASTVEATQVVMASSSFTDIGVDGAGNMYVIGVVGAGLYTFSPGVTVSVPAFVLVKYDSSGTALWVKTVGPETKNPLHISNFFGLCVDGSGNCYVGGGIYCNLVYDFGNGVSAVGALTDRSNALLVKYDNTGIAQWAKTIMTGTILSSYTGVAVNSSGEIYVSGIAGGLGSLGPGNSISVKTLLEGFNSFLVKYGETK